MLAFVMYRHHLLCPYATRAKVCCSYTTTHTFDPANNFLFFCSNLCVTFGCACVSLRNACRVFGCVCFYHAGWEWRFSGSIRQAEVYNNTARSRTNMQIHEHATKNIRSKRLCKQLGQCSSRPAVQVPNKNLPPPRRLLLERQNMPLTLPLHFVIGFCNLLLDMPFNCDYRVGIGNVWRMSVWRGCQWL